ncbi:glycoside hydrolase family 125 protein [Anaerococcus sp.]|uniref:glycoside hydrolase family 125 protein n=1 Tax=Anaerococcus sp. TaxID=1872515 RepID=UPI0027BAEFE8|nr:glycoside hydrolase family 125 protein [Anaerococcus sp.]
MKEIVKELIDQVNESDDLSPEIKKIFAKAINNTFTTTMKETERGDVFVITGDIEAMWLRDSSGQIRPLFYLASKEADELIRKVLKRQIFCLDKDLYANAFNLKANSRSWSDKDITDFDSPWVWERKYELDSLCYVMEVAYMYYEKTHDKTIFNEEFIKVLERILDLIKLEQNHENSTYEFERPDPWAPSDSLRNGKRGTDTGFTGMSWTGFRPSDDSCLYQYLIPANAFATVALKRLAKALRHAEIRPDLCENMYDLACEIDQGIREYGIIEDEDFGKIYAYETDGIGSYNLMDDANIPSLLSLPYLGYVDKKDPIYKNTRAFILSEKNKNYFEGKVAKGIGSDHTPKDYIWHLALAMELMTADSRDEMDRLLSYFEKTHASKYLMHEGFHKDDPSEYTRDWFSWANSIFVEAVLRYIGKEFVKAS